VSLALSGSAALRRSPVSATAAEGSAFKAQPHAARILIGGVMAIGMGALFFQPPGTAYAHPGAFLLLLTLAAIAAVFKVDLPLSHHGATMSLSFAFEFASLLLLGPHATMVIAATSAWVQSTAGGEGRNPLHRTMFSMAALVVTALVGSHVYLLLGGPLAMQTPVRGGFETPAMAAAMSYFVLNTLLVATAVGLESGQPLRKIWNDHIVWCALSFVVGAGAAAAGVALLQDKNAWAVGLLMVPLYLIHRTYGLYFERLDVEQGRVKEVSDLHLATVEALALAIDAKDQTATAHIRRVQVFAAGLAEAMGMSPGDVHGVRTAALLHDIGKLAVPEHILSKPGPLTQEEFHRMKVHPQVGAEIIAHVPFPYPVAPLILNHHERWDGKGYPNGLSGEQIPLGARILAAVDYFDALTSERPFHKAMQTEEALDVVQGEAGQALDPSVVDALVRLLPDLEARADLVAEPAQRVTLAEDRRLAEAPLADAPAKNVFQDIALAHREIYALYEIAQSMGTSLGVADTMALVASKLSNLVPFSSCALFLYDEEHDSLRCRFATGVDAERLQALSIANGEGLQGWVGRNQRPLVNARPAADLEAANVAGETSLQSALVCPLVFDGNLIGTLAVYHSEPARFTDDHRRLLDRVAEQAAGVVNNSMVFEQTKRDSLTDNLTGLPNTRFMFVHLTRELARAERLATEVSLLVMDLDGFKEINDTYGHHVGDRALREVARVLRNGIRPYDICVRYAGDEFVVVLSGCGAQEAEQKRRELQQAIEDIPFEVRPGQMVKLGSSFGFAVFPHDGEAYETLLSTADQRMYQDKAQRKARLNAPAQQTPDPNVKRPSVFAKIPRQPAADRAH
jgi:diguanylate cyclase (GGDEF)-like protein/putative nucleotidyltransferase with HDIG domain